jgi:hypothetical protein
MSEPKKPPEIGPPLECLNEAPNDTVEQRLPDAKSKCGKMLLSDYEMRALTLDLVYANWPQGHWPPAALTALLKTVLGLPDDHQVGGWPLYFTDEEGHVQDRRGPKRDYVQWLAAIDIEREYMSKTASDKQKELHPPKQLPAELREQKLAELEREFTEKEAELKREFITKRPELERVKEEPEVKERALAGLRREHLVKRDEIRSKYIAKRDEIEGKGLPLTTAEFRAHVKPMPEAELLAALQARFPQSAAPTTLTARGTAQPDSI